jgi:hypothetical protein
MADGSEGTAAKSNLAQAMRDGYCVHCGKQLPLHDDGNPVTPYFCGLACFYGKIEADGRARFNAPAPVECTVCGEECEGSGPYCSDACRDWDSGETELPAVPQ